MTNTNISSDCRDNVAGRMDGSSYLKLHQSQIVRTNIYAISQLLNTGLSQEVLDICTKLIESGVHPQALTQIMEQIKETNKQYSKKPKIK